MARVRRSDPARLHRRLRQRGSASSPLVIMWSPCLGQRIRRAAAPADYLCTLGALVALHALPVHCPACSARLARAAAGCASRGVEEGLWPAMRGLNLIEGWAGVSEVEGQAMRSLHPTGGLKGVLRVESRLCAASILLEGARACLELFEGMGFLVKHSFENQLCSAFRCPPTIVITR